MRCAAILAASILSQSFVGETRAAELMLPKNASIFLADRLGLWMFAMGRHPEKFTADDFSAWAAGFWSKFDRNGDGVTPDEVRHRMIEVPLQEDPTRSAKEQRYDNFQLTEYMQIFVLDPNHDGIVTTDEIAAMTVPVYAYADQDGNGIIDNPELHRFYAASGRTTQEHCVWDVGCTWD
jgi:hypothetical protein